MAGRNCSVDPFTLLPDHGDLARLGGVSRARRPDPPLKLMSYKGWVPEDADLPTIRAFFDDAWRQHQRVICDDTRPAVAALGGARPDRVLVAACPENAMISNGSRGSGAQAALRAVASDKNYVGAAQTAATV